jgi:hypothetical protein
MRKTKVILFSILLCSVQLIGQVTIGNGENSLEISGSIATYLNFRDLDSGVVDQSKNRFNLRDAQIQLEGRSGKYWEYKIQFDIADVIAGVNDPENPGLMDAWMQYKRLKAFDIKMGYGKIAWSRFDQTAFNSSVYWQRPEFLRGSFASMRDVGVELSKSFWKQRAHINLGVYTGLGEVSLKGDNDPSGAFEYTGRIDIGWPTQYRFLEIDTRHVRKPMFGIGLNGRYTKRNLPSGTFFPSGAVSSYGIKTVDGEKQTYGFDAAFQWQGFSAQFEIIQIKMTPQDSTNFLFYSNSSARAGGNIFAGGWVAQASYHIAGIHTIVSGRYETFNANDLLLGINERFSAALAYQIDGFKSMIKAQYIHIISKENINAADWVNQYRIGWQYQF